LWSKTKFSVDLKTRNQREAISLQCEMAFSFVLAAGKARLIANGVIVSSRDAARFVNLGGSASSPDPFFNHGRREIAFRHQCHPNPSIRLLHMPQNDFAVHDFANPVTPLCG
jgi:hypothetical protein